MTDTPTEIRDRIKTIKVWRIDTDEDGPYSRTLTPDELADAVIAAIEPKQVGWLTGSGQFVGAYGKERPLWTPVYRFGGTDV